MAIYHMTAKIVSRKKGKDSTAAAAYRSGEKIVDQRTGNIYDYTSRRNSIAATGLFMPESVTWQPDRAELWNRIEIKNNRKDAQTAREYEVSLPHELSNDERWTLISNFARSIANRYGVAADLAIHKPNDQGDSRNHHAHILITTNVINSNGSIGGKKREMNDRAEYKKIRKEWEDAINQALKRAGYDSRVDCRSLKEQGIDRLPTIHVGVRATNMERQRFIISDRKAENVHIKEVNKLKQLKAEKTEIQKSLDEVTTTIETQRKAAMQHIATEPLQPISAEQTKPNALTKEELIKKAKDKAEEALKKKAKELIGKDACILYPVPSKPIKGYVIGQTLHIRHGKEGTPGVVPGMDGFILQDEKNPKVVTLLFKSGYTDKDLAQIEQNLKSGIIKFMEITPPNSDGNVKGKIKEVQQHQQSKSRIEIGGR